MYIVENGDAFVKYIAPLGGGFVVGIGLFSATGSFALSFFATAIILAAGVALFASELPFFPHGMSVLLIGVGMWSGSVYLDSYMNAVSTESERELRGESVRIVSEADIRNSSARYTVELTDGTRALLFTKQLPQHSYGERLVLNGELQEAPVFENFDYRAFLKKEGIDAVIYYPEVTRKREASPSFIGSLLSFKKHLRSSLSDILPYPHNTIAGAMILGDGTRVPEGLGELFSAAGIRHIIAISGLHVTIIAGILLAIMTSFFRLGRDPAFYSISFLIILFVIFVGSPPSAIRAGIMAIITLLAYKMGRIYSAWRALLVAAVVMLLFNPLLLAHDVGFQLSFLAILGILFLAPPFERLLGRTTSFLNTSTPFPTLRDGIISLLAVSFGAHIATLPVVAYTFDILSFSAPLANLIAVPLAPLIIVSSAGAAIFGLLSPFLGTLLALPALVSLEVIIRSVELLDMIPISSIELEVTWLWVVAAYTFLSAVLIYIYFLYSDPQESFPSPGPHSSQERPV